MVRVNLQFDPYVLTAMFEIVKVAHASLRDHLAVDIHKPDDDPDLLEAWEGELRENLREDCHYLLATLEKHRHGQTQLELDEETAESVLRACSAIRLKLRESTLRTVPSGELENGQVDLMSLPTEQQQCYACYLFLASLQSLILHELDPDCDDF